ncbi:FAD binding domain protein [Xylariaceae sp. FL0804]|nr:FAD binding domain protein [Xylariaceae sp. FL0804]
MEAQPKEEKQQQQPAAVATNGHEGAQTSSSSRSTLPIREEGAGAGAKKAETADPKADPDPPLPILRRETCDAAAFDAAVWGRVFNRHRDGSRGLPRAVVAATSAADVRRAVALARRESGGRVSVRSGGHSWAAWSVRHDAVLVDLSGLGGGEGGGGIVYDERSRIASCGPATTGKVLNAFLGERGRMFAGGHCPDVGLGGFLLQGGMGWNCKNWGWACESVVGIDVVTADAKELYCSSVENPDLFWAARGAGPGFPAIITRFHLLTRPLLELYNCIYVYPQSMFRTVLQWVIDICPTADEDTEVVCVSRHAPDGSGDIDIIAGFTTFKRDRAAAEQALRPVHDSRPQGPEAAKVAVFCEATSLAREYVTQGQANPEGHRYCVENAYVRDDVADVPAVLERAFTTLPSRESFALYFAMNPTSRRPPPADMALSMQSDHYFAIYSVWKDTADDAKCVDWTRDVIRGIEPHAAGSYMGDADFQHRRTRYWSAENGRRLAEIRRRWDPDGVFCGYLDAGDKSGVDGLRNEFEWEQAAPPR